jgi:hypothetical protein
VVVSWLLLYPQTCSSGVIYAALLVCILLIRIFRSLLINFKGMFLFGSRSHSFHIIHSGDKWWMHKYVTFAQSVVSVVDIIAEIGFVSG